MSGTKRRADSVSLRQLEYFVATASNRTITAAAEKLGISQSTLSQQLGELERIVGTRLLVRHSGGVVLTEPGRVLADRAQRVLAEAARAVWATRAASAQPVRPSAPEASDPLLAQAIQSGTR